ncbi:MAG: prepilin peptidase [Candidatus Azambacteria bacterium]|nr:prepilin peptidase [Candidatus Azambacteria bacterium]
MGLTARIRPVAAVLPTGIVMILLSSFVFGLVFGSFLNVVIYRLKNGRNVIFGRSFCPECKTQLKWHDLIPLLSFIYLRGRCRYCDEKISWQYPLVELISSLLWVLIFYKFALPAEALAKAGVLDIIYYIFILSVFLVIAVYDFKWRIIPDKIIYPAIVVVLIYNFNVLSLLVAVIAFLFFFMFFYFSKGRAMGLGDAKLAFLIGLFLSPLLAIVAFILAFIIGAVFGIILIGLGKKTLKSQIAFAPFLVLGATIAFFLSDFIINFFQP